VSEPGRTPAARSRPRYDGRIAHETHSAPPVKYRLTRDDGAELDVPGSLWEVVLERAYLNGWRPSGTRAPWEADQRSPRVATIPDASLPKTARWPESDYFSASSQHVYAEDAFELGTAVMRGHPRRAEEDFLPDPKKEAVLSRVASFARIGGFVIGRAPDRSAPGEGDDGDREDP
jgi:hypothetical protein